MRVAIVTGAGQGLGRATALALHKEGYALALCGRTWKKLSDVTQEITEAGGTTMARQVDVRSSPSIAKFVDDVMEVYGRVDVLVNNAGYAHDPDPVTSLNPGALTECFETNVFGPFVFMHFVIPLMVERYRATSERSVIVNVASKAARWPTPRMSAYSASKAALVALTQACAKELEEDGFGVKCVSISPGGMNTEMRARVAGPEDAAKQQSPEFVAHVIADIVRLGAIPTFGVETEHRFPRSGWSPRVQTRGPIEVETEHRFFPRSGPVQNRPDYVKPVPNGADVLVWKGEVTVTPGFRGRGPMEDLR